MIAVFASLIWWLKSVPNEFGSFIEPSRKKANQGASANQKSKEETGSKEMLDREAQKRLLIESANVPIKFWGKVVDQEGNPLGNVTVKYRVQRSAIFSSSGNSIVGSVESSPDGLFSISNVRGATLEMEDFVRNGYRIMSNQQVNFGYSRTPEVYKPTANSPRIYIMETKYFPVSVTSVSQQLRLPWDGKPIRIDLDSGKPSPSGKLVLTASRTAATGRFGWILSLTVEGGELKEAESGAAFIAPEDGYHPTWECGYKAEDKPWRLGRDADVYYRINGKYGRLKLQIYAHAGPNDVSIHFERFVNSSGGRNTERRQ